MYGVDLFLSSGGSRVSASCGGGIGIGDLAYLCCTAFPNSDRIYDVSVVRGICVGGRDGRNGSYGNGRGDPTISGGRNVSSGHDVRFTWKYLSCLLLDFEKVKKTKVNIDYCYTYYEIGIQKYEFGIESKWKCHNSTNSHKQGALVKSSENNNREGLVESIKFFFMSMKKRDNNPIGNLILEDLKETAEGLHRHLMKGDTKMRIWFLRRSPKTLTNTFWWIQHNLE